jgi:hypothetical protein
MRRFGLDTITTTTTGNIAAMPVCTKEGVASVKQVQAAAEAFDELMSGAEELLGRRR